MKKLFVADLPTMPVVMAYVTGSGMILAPFVAWESIAAIFPWEFGFLVISGMLVGHASFRYRYHVFHRRSAGCARQQASVISYLEPFGAILWGWLILSEPLSAITLFGALLILGGTYLILSGDRMRPQG